MPVAKTIGSIDKVKDWNTLNSKRDPDFHSRKTGFAAKV